MFRSVLTVLFVILVVSSVDSAKPPHIILIIADDLGFNDVSFRGSEDIHTPNIDALGYSGRILDRHYVLPTCTPSRASLLTGQYAVRTGMQGYPLQAGEPRGLPLNFPLLPQFLKNLNYSTYLIGKWHEGNHRWAYTPTHRGFDTFLGFYNGMIGYFSHEIMIEGWPGGPEVAPKGYDMHRNEETAFELRGRYATNLFTEEAENLIKKHPPEKPLFLQLAHLAPHIGENKTQNEVANEAANDKRFAFIKDDHQRRYAGAMAALDDSVGKIVKSLADRDMLSDSLIVFIGDNGAPTTGRFNTSGSNWPLRGQKETLFEGAIRTAGVVWHAAMKPTSKLYTDLFHVTDWLPTFYEAAGGDLEDLGDIDGVSQWSRLLDRNSSPSRTEFLVNSRQSDDAAYIQGWWKYIVGATILPELFRQLLGDPRKTPGRHPYNLCKVVNSETSKLLSGASKEVHDFQNLGLRAAQLRQSATLPSTCRANAAEEVFNCENGCLFNLRDDPCETRNLVKDHPEIVSSLLLKLRSWTPKIIPELNTEIDFSSDPRNHGGVWIPWLDIPAVPANDTITMAADSNLAVNFLGLLFFTAIVFCLTLNT